MIFKKVLFLVGILAFPATVQAAPFAYVGNFNDATASVIDTATASVIDTLDVGTNPQAVWVSPDGSKALITNLFDESVSVIDTATNTVSGTISLPATSRPAGVAIHPRGNFAYVTDSDNARVLVIDMATLTLLPPGILVGNSPQLVDFHPSGSFAYVTNFSDNTVTVISTDAPLHTPVTTIPVGVNPQGLALDPSGSLLYVGSAPGNSITVIDTATNTAIDTIDNIPEVEALIVHPSGNPLYATSGDGEAKVIDTGTRSLITSVPLSTDLQGVDINAAGTLLYVVSNDSSAVFLIDTATNQVVDDIPVGDAPHAFGRFIVPEAIMALSSSNLDFGNQEIGTSSAPQNVTLANTGNGILNISNLTVSGDFSFTHDCGASVPPKGVCNVAVIFAPTTAGFRNGTLEILSNDVSSPEAITLSGNGTQSPNPIVPDLSGGGCGLVSRGENSLTTGVGLLLLGGVAIFLTRGTASFRNSKKYS